MTWARCSECDRTFGGDSGFDRHRIMTKGQPGYDPDYDWRCATPAEMRRRGMHQDAKGWWHQETRFGRGASPRTPVDAEKRAESEAYERYVDFERWAEQDRREDPRYADEEPCA